MTSHPDRALPMRVTLAALVLGAGGLVLARGFTLYFAAIATPSFDRMLRPAKFVYGGPPGWEASATWMSPLWLGVIAAALVFPLLLNPGWFSRRILSVPGIVKLLLTAGLFSIIPWTSLIGSDMMSSVSLGGSHLPLGSQIIAVALAGVCGGALCGLFGEGMLLGAPDSWITRDAARAGVARAYTYGFVAGALVAILGVTLSGAFDLFFQALISFLGESAEVSPLGWQRLNLGLALGIGLLMAASGAVLVAFSPAATSRARRVTSVVVAAVPAVALISLTMWFKDYCRTQGEMGTTLTQAMRLEPAPPARLMVLAGTPGPRAYTYDMKVRLPASFGEDTVGATLKNVEMAGQYLRASTERWTAHTFPAWEIAPYIYDRLLEPDKAMRSRANLAEATGSLMASAVLMRKLAIMPKTEILAHVAERMRDTTRFVAGQQATVRLQAEAIVVRDRSVSGTVDAADRQHVRVALYYQTDATPPSQVPTAMSLVAATTPDARGRFSFDGLPPAFYSVGVLLPENLGSDPRKLTVQGTLRVVDLSKDRKTDSVGAVQIFSVK